MKKYTVKELAYLFHGNGRIEVIFEEEPDKVYYYDDTYTIEEIIDIFGERRVIWITVNATDGDEHLVIELEGEE